MKEKKSEKKLNVMWNKILVFKLYLRILLSVTNGFHEE